MVAKENGVHRPGERLRLPDEQHANRYATGYREQKRAASLARQPQESPTRHRHYPWCTVRVETRWRKM